jgi:hypothetical protein
MPRAAPVINTLSAFDIQKSPCVRACCFVALENNILLRSPGNKYFTFMNRAQRADFMTTTAKFLRRHPSEVKPWTETCGQIRPLIEDADGSATEVHHLKNHPQLTAQTFDL